MAADELEAFSSEELDSLEMTAKRQLEQQRATACSAFFPHALSTAFSAAPDNLMRTGEVGFSHFHQLSAPQEVPKKHVAAEYCQIEDKDAFSESILSTVKPQTTAPSASPVKCITSSEKSNIPGSSAIIKVQLCMVGSDRIGAHSLYHQKLKLIYQSVQGRTWDPEMRMWTFPKEQLQNLYRNLKQMSSPPDIMIETVPPLPPEFDAVGSPVQPKGRGENSWKYDIWNVESCNCLVTFSLHGHEQIAAKFSYQQDVVAAMRKINASWHDQERLWTFPSSCLMEATQCLSSIGGVKIEPVPPLELPRALLDNSDINKLSSSSTIQSASKSPQPKVYVDEQTPTRKRRRSLENEDIPSTCDVRLWLHSGGLIAAQFQYHKDVEAAIKCISKAEWQANERTWMFPLSSLLEAENTLSKLNKVKVRLVSLHPLVKRAIQASASILSLEGNYSLIPVQLESQLMHFQREGVRFALRHGGRVLIGDEMGLGKTLQALALVSCFKEDWPVLIIAPPSIRMHWATVATFCADVSYPLEPYHHKLWDLTVMFQMLNQWLNIPSSKITVVMSNWIGSNPEGYHIVGSGGRCSIQLNNEFNILSYDIVQKMVEGCAKMDFKVIIADESHYMKNPKAKRTNACIPLLRNAKYAILLTGTPALSRPIELLKQLEALQPDVYCSISEYGERYCMGGAFGGWQGATNLHELHALLKSTVMVRRLKRDVMTELPRKRRQQVFLFVDEKWMRQLRALFSQLKEVKIALRSCENPELGKKLKLQENNVMMQLYSESAAAKIPAVIEYLSTVVEANCKFLVFAHHLVLLDAIQGFFKKKNVDFIRIDGTTPQSCRQSLVDKFQNEDKVKAAALGIRACGVGITLTAASTVIFAEMSWSPGDLLQAEDRVHRIGQESSVNIYYLHAHDTVDSIIWDIVKYKLEHLGQVLDGREQALDVAPPVLEYDQPARIPGLSPFAQASPDAVLRPCISRAS